MAQEDEQRFAVWKVLGVTTEQVKLMDEVAAAEQERLLREYENESNGVDEPAKSALSEPEPTKHRLIVQNPVFPFSEPTPVAMSPDKKRFYTIVDSKSVVYSMPRGQWILANNSNLTAYSMPSGRRLWKDVSYFYENKLLATNKGIFAEYFDPDAYRLDGSGMGAGGIRFFTIKSEYLSSFEHVGLVPAISEDGTFLALRGNNFEEISVLNTGNFEIEELAIDTGTFEGAAENLEPWVIAMNFYESLSREDYTNLREKFWAKYAVKPLLYNDSELQDIYTSYTRPKQTPLYPTLNIKATAYSIEKEYAFAGDSPYVFIMNTLTGRVTSHKLENTTSIQLLAFSADGKSLVALNSTGTLHIYKNGQWQQIETGIEESHRFIAVDSQGDAVWLAHDSTLYFISVKNSQVLSSVYSSSIRALAFSPKIQKAVVLAQDDSEVTREGFESIITTDTDISAYGWGKMRTLCMVIPALEEKELLSFDGETLLLRNAFSYIRNTEGTRMHFKYNMTSTAKEIIIKNDSEYFSMNHMYRVVSFHEIAPHMYMNNNAKVLTVYDVTMGNYNSVLEMYRGAYQNIHNFVDVYFTQRGTFVSLGEDSSLILWSITKNPAVPLLRYHFFTDGNYIVTNEDGNFFSPAEEKLTALHWVKSKAPLETIAFDILADMYRDENIIQKALRQ